MAEYICPGSAVNQTVEDHSAREVNCLSSSSSISVIFAVTHNQRVEESYL